MEVSLEQLQGKPAPEPTGWRGRLVQAENLLVVLPMAIMVVLPILEIVLRRFQTGLSGSAAFVQNCTLLVGMIGGMIAAREDRLLSLSTFTHFLTGGWKVAAAVFNRSVSAALSGFLCVAGARFVLQERADAAMVAWIPAWIIELVMPVGFAFIALRLVLRADESWKIRGLTLGLAVAWAAAAVLWPGEPESLILPGTVLVIAATVCGAPVYILLGGLALVFLYGYAPDLGIPPDKSIITIPIKHHSLVTNPTLPSIPLFTMAGYLLADGGSSQRLVRVFQALTGHLRGGPAVLTALVCAFFTSFTGASGVTILALGGLLLPVLISAGYKERTSLGLLTGAGSLGLLFPPCLPPILYAIVAGTVIGNLDVEMLGGNPEMGDITIERMFAGGLIPGALLVLLTAAWGVWVGPREHSRAKFDWKEAKSAIWTAKWELLLPVVALTALFGGWATPVEAAAVTALYAFIAETLLYRDFKSVKQLMKTITECGLLVGGVLLILGIAMGFTQYLILDEIPAKGVEWVRAHISSQWAFLLALNGFLLVVGCLMDVFSAIVVVVPLIVPMGIAFQVDPIHLGIVFLANLELGFLTPPVGMNLFLSAYRFNKPMGEVIRATLPMLVVLAIGVILITYVPWMTTFLPSLMK